MQRPTFTVTLPSTSFLNRRLYSIRDQDTNNLFVECTVCFKESCVVAEKSSLALQCGHMIQCTECRDYNLEKIMRCEKCCRDILGYFIEGCRATCPRNTSTVKASALCAVCGSHLRKEARCCRSSDSLKLCKKQLRSSMTVLVQRPTLIENPSPKDRPCSHYTLCQFCKSSVTKGHRSSTACKVCRSKKRPASVLNVDTKEKLPSPERKRRCTLGTLAAVAGEMNEEEEDKSMSNITIPRISTLLPKHPVATPRFDQPSPTLRFGPKCGAPIWALVNHSHVQPNTPGKFFSDSR